MTEPAAPDDDPIIEVEDFSFFYGSKQVLFNIGMTFETNRVTPSSGPPAAENPPCSATSTA